MASPKVPNTKVPNAKIRIEDVITKDGKFDSDKFWKLSDTQIADLVGEAVYDIRTYIIQPSTHKKAAASVRLLEALDKEDPDLGLSHYVTLFKSIESGDGSALSKSYFDSLKQYDPYTFAVYSKYPGGEVASIPGFNFYEYKRTGNGVIESAEPTARALTSNSINSASSAEAAPGALTNPPLKLPNVGKTVEEAADTAYTGKEPPIADYNTPIISPGVHVGFKDAEGKPVDLTPEEITKFNPNTASPSPEAIGEAMRDAVKDRVGDTQLNKEDIPAFLTKEGKVKAAEGATKSEAEAETKAATDKTEPKASETAETPQGLLSRIGGHIGRNWGKYLGGLGGLGTLGYVAIRDLASDDSTLKSLFRGDYSTAVSNTPSVNQPRNEPAANEEYVPGKIPSHIPQDNLPPIKESTNSKKVKNRPQQQQQQVVNAPALENNATADYVRAAYNSYIPSDAGRAYQKAIYGDPLELDRMRLQQQQQKWRDFVMRSGQSPAELVQRGLMPYDALQYI